MHLLHLVTQLRTEPHQDIALPRIVLRVHTRLHLFVFDDTERTERTCGLRRVERRARLLYFSQELLPGREVVPQATEDVFRFEIPKRLELQPFVHVFT